MSFPLGHVMTPSLQSVLLTLVFFLANTHSHFPYSRRPKATCTVDVASVVDRATSRVRRAATSIRVQHCRPSSRNVGALFVPRALDTAVRHGIGASKSACWHSLPEALDSRPLYHYRR